MQFFNVSIFAKVTYTNKDGIRVTEQHITGMSIQTTDRDTIIFSNTSLDSNSDFDYDLFMKKHVNFTCE